MARPLADDEVRRLTRKHQAFLKAQQQEAERVSRALADRDREIAKLMAAGASPTGIARALGLTRAAVYSAQLRYQRSVTDGS